jgi:hypothetical protein
MKLMNIERSIGIYDRVSEERLKDVDLDITLGLLKTIVTPNDDDPELIDGYVLDERQLLQLSSYSSNIIVPNFEKYFYVLQCLGNYDWDSSTS